MDAKIHNCFGTYLSIWKTFFFLCVYFSYCSFLIP
ncbi:unnamed protein product [Acanthoscelides obtectus]|uniref:Uncharacterized protein n=1 Tax=Acanthoscelides obtectus TaxID=200917 RepID=A0A9P0NZK7_ACAOB|nr:unnamed protein product [Acanthoscelides obtectus]CAK1647828.1 hypothetical protein AOBTE_LOCUS15420 [Acanthoscelides obtectus]